MILTAFLRALAQTGDPRFRKVLWRGLGLTVALLAGVTALVVWGAGWLVGDTVHLWWVGDVHWVDNVVSWAFLLLMIPLSALLMIPVASGVVSMFLDEVAEAVEDRHYPALPKVSGTPLMDDIRDGLSAFGVMVVANVAAFALTLALPVAGVPVFYALNGYLLGREYFTLVAMRREGRARAYEMRHRYAGRIWLAGVLMALPLTVPLLNLVIPILGAATFTHIYHGLRARA